MNVLGIGHTIIDSIIHVDTSFAEELSGGRGGMLPATPREIKQIIDLSGQEPFLAPGGTVCNVLRALSRLGNRCTFLAKFGQDEIAERLHEMLKRNGLLIEFAKSEEGPTGHVLSLVEPDGARTFRSSHGAARKLTAREIPASLFEEKNLVHFEGYTLYNKGLFPQAMTMAKSRNAKVSMDLSSFQVVKEHKTSLKDLIQRFVDVTFCNAQEAQELTGTDLKTAAETISRMGCTAVVTDGEFGCWIAEEGRARYYNTDAVKARDTTGAGDFFAAGFLHRWLQGSPIAACVDLGQRLAREVVQVDGVVLTEETWKQITPARSRQE